MGQPILEYPAAPAADDAGCRRALDRLFEQAAEAGRPELVVATDGSSQDGVGSFAVVCNLPLASAAGADSSEDQSAFRMELRALDLLFAALAGARRPPRKLWILVDCEAAIKAICCPATCGLCRLAARVHSAGSLARRRGTTWTLVWVPSHGKKASWAPPPALPMPSDVCRLLNQYADDEAKRLCRRRHAGSARATWHLALLQAAQREQNTIRVAATASRRLETHLCTARAQVPDPHLIEDDV